MAPALLRHPPPMRLSVALFVLAVPALAAAQVSQVDLQIGSANSVSLSKEDCGRNLTINFTLNPALILLPCSPFRVWSTTSDTCGNEPGTSDHVFYTQNLSTNTNSTGSFQLAVADLQAATGSDAGVCSAGEVEQTFLLCGAFQYETINTGCSTSSIANAKDTDPATIDFDSKPPSPPQLFEAVGHTSSLTVSLSVDEDTSTVTLTAVDTVDGTTVRKDAAAGSSANIGGLTNGHLYKVTAVAKDLAGNVSDVSNEIEGTPVEIGGFFNRYVDAGGNTGGCSATGPGSFGALALLAAAALGFRRRTAR